MANFNDSQSESEYVDLGRLHYVLKDAKYKLNTGSVLLGGGL